MANTLPIRILIAGGSPDDREQVGSFLRAHDFSVLETPEPGSFEPDFPEFGPPEPLEADAVVMIEPVSQEQQTSAATASSPPLAPVVLLTKAPTIAQQASSQVIPMSKLPCLPALIEDVVEYRRCSSKSDQPEYAVAMRAMMEGQRLIAIGRLLAEIAHEINNPLESVGNLLYLAIHDGGMSERATGYLDAAEHELQRVIQISKQTLSFSRESSEPVPIQMAELMDEVVGLYSRRIAQKNLKVVREYSRAQSIMGFPGEVRQVLSNLVTNAIEASSDGGKLRLRVRETMQFGLQSERKGVRVTIGDNGSGIPKEARKRLGEIFFTTKGETGTGLGLWVTNSIVARNSGTMRLRSATGERHGTIFTIFLPPVSAAVIGSPDETEKKTHTAGNVTEISRHRRFASHDQHQSTGRRVAG